MWAFGIVVWELLTYGRQPLHLTSSLIKTYISAQQIFVQEAVYSVLTACCIVVRGNHFTLPTAGLDSGSTTRVL